MTVRQDAPRLEQTRPLTVPTGLFVAFALIVTLALVAVAVWMALVPGATPTMDGFDAVEKLHRLRETIPGGGFI